MESIREENRALINDFLLKHWYSTDMIVRGQSMDMTKASGLFALENGEIMGLVTYIIRDNVMEILSLDSLREKQGLGTRLLQAAIEEARKGGCRKVVLVTTNDNLNALRFYQKRGFDMVRLYRNAMDAARKQKPGIPLIGENDIPLKHEIELELVL